MRQLPAPPGKMRSREISVTPDNYLPNAEGVVQRGNYRPLPQPSLLEHYVGAIKERIRLRIDGHTARAATSVLRAQMDHLKLINDYQAAIGGSRIAQLEHEVRTAELQQRMDEIVAQRHQSYSLARLRLRKEQLSLTKDKTALRLEIAKLRKELRETGVPTERKLTPAEQRLAKRKDIEEQLERLAEDEARAVARAGTEAEKRRYQNIYANKRDRLIESLENFL